VKINSIAGNHQLVNNLLGMLVATALVWGVVMFNKSPAVPEIGVPQVVEQRAAGRTPVIVDVRGPEAYGRGHIEGAVHIPLGDLQARAKELPTDMTAPMVVYCGNGSNLGPRGTAKLQSMGYTNAANLAGGIEGWRSAGQKVVQGRG
jgi:rhodanese-related sulfurtransferase